MTIDYRRQQVIESLLDKEYRDLYVAEHISQGIAFQIHAMREQRGWTQEELGKRSGKAQEKISQLENPDYGKLTLSTLKALASAFDVALEVRFVAFSTLVDDILNLAPEDLEVPDFDNDRELTQGTNKTLPGAGSPFDRGSTADYIGGTVLANAGSAAGFRLQISGTSRVAEEYPKRRLRESSDNVIYMADRKPSITTGIPRVAVI